MEHGILWPQGRAASLKKSPDITESALRRALAELERSVQDTKRESRATDTRVARLEQGRLGLAEQVADTNTRCAADQCLFMRGARAVGQSSQLGGRLRACRRTARSSHEEGSCCGGHVTGLL